MHRRGTVRPKAPPGAPPKPPPPPKGQHQQQQPPRHVSQPVSRRQQLAPRPLQQPLNTHAASPNDTLPGVPGTPASPGTPSHDPSTPNHGPIDAGFGERPSAASSRRLDDPVLPFKVGTRRVVNRGPSGPVSSRQPGGAGPSVRPASSTQPSPSAPTTVHGAHKSVAPPRSPPAPYAKSPTNGPRGGGGGSVPVPAPPPPQPLQQQQQASAPSPWPLAAHPSSAPVSEGSGGAGSSRSATPAASLSQAGRSLPAEEPVVALNPVSTVSGCLIIENMSVALLDGGSDAGVMAEMKAALREDFATALRHPVSLVSVDSIGGHPLAVCLSVHLTDGMSRVDIVGKLQQLMQNAGYAKGSDAQEAAAAGGGRRVLVLPCTSRVYSEHTGRFTPEVVFAGDLSWFVAQPAPDANMRVGHRVVRHAAHWMWGDQDGGEGGEGTVVDCDVAGGWAVVRWDSSSEANKYRWGPVSGAYDLRVVGSEDTGAGAGGARPQSTSPQDRSSSAASQPSSQPHITPPRQPTASARAALAAQQLQQQQQQQQQQPVAPAEQPQAPRPPPPSSPPAGIGLGARVRRNPTVWDEGVYGAPDGGRGGLGTVVKITGESWTLGDDGRPQADASVYVCVSWDHEARARGVTSAAEAAKTGRMYRWGVEGVFDVVVDASPADPRPAAAPQAPPQAPPPPPQTLPQMHPQPQPIPAPRSPLDSNQAVRCVQVTVLSSRGVPTVTSKVQASFESELPEQTSVWRGPDPSWGETLALDVPPGVATNLSGRMLRVLLLGSPSDRADLMMPVGGCEIELGHLVGPSSQTLWIAVDPSMQSRLVASPSAPGRSLQTATSPDATCWLRISLGFVFVQLQQREPEDVPSRPAYHSWSAAAETYPQATPAPAAPAPAAYLDPAAQQQQQQHRGGRDVLSAASPYSPSAPPAAPRTPGGGHYAAAPPQPPPPVDSERAMSPGRGRPWPVDMTMSVAHSDNVRREESYVGHHAQRRSVHAPPPQPQPLPPAPSSPAHAPAQTHLRMREVQAASQQPGPAALGPAARRALSPQRRSRGSGDASHPTSPSLAPAQAPQAPAAVAAAGIDARSDSAAAFHAHQARSIQTPNRRGLSPTRPHARGSAQLSPSSAPSSAPHYAPQGGGGGGGGGAPIYSVPPHRASSSRHSSVAAHHPQQQQPADLRFGLPQQQQQLQQLQQHQYPPSAASIAPSTPRAAAASGPPPAAAALFADGLDGPAVAPADGDATSAVEYLVQLNFDPVTVLEVARLLKQQHVEDVGTLRLLSEPDLRAIGVPLGCRRRIATALNLGLGR